MNFNSTSTNQTISGSTTTTFNNLMIDKSSNQLTVSTATKVNGTLTMTSGNIVAPALVELGTSTSSVGTLSYTAGNIIGCFKRWINAIATGILFPVGTATNNHHASVTFTNLTSGSLTVCFNSADPGNTGLPLTDDGFSVDAQFTEGYWSMTAADGLASVNYDLELTGTGFNSHAFDANTRIITRPASGSWTATGWGTYSPAVGETAKRTGLSATFGEFGLGVNACTVAGTLTPAASTTICENANVNLIVTLTSGNNANWSYEYNTVPPSGVNTAVSGNNVSTSTISKTLSTSTTYKLYKISDGTCIKNY